MPSPSNSFLPPPLFPQPYASHRVLLARGLRLSPLSQVQTLYGRAGRSLVPIAGPVHATRFFFMGCRSPPCGYGFSRIFGLAVPLPRNLSCRMENPPPVVWFHSFLYFSLSMSPGNRDSQPFFFLCSPPNIVFLSSLRESGWAAFDPSH